MKILIAANDPVCMAQLEDMLTPSDYQVTPAADGAAAVRILAAPDGPLLAILGADLAGQDGANLLSTIRANAGEHPVYLIALAAHGDPQAMTALLQAGADDYLVYPLDAQEVLVRVGAGRRITELEEELRYRATRDALTNVYNRGAIIDLLEKEVARQGRLHHPVSIILCDLDHFKEVNDRFGHLAGDAVLRELTRRMDAVMRPYDAFGRYGSEEMLCVLPDCAMAGALEVAERMRAAVADTAVPTAAGAVSITVSIGVATVARNEISSLSQLLQRADHALHRAKQNGRNCVNIGS